MAFNLQEYILFRTEVGRELFNAEVDNNFKMVANPWTAERVYEEGNIVYHPVQIVPETGDEPTGGNEQQLAWWRAKERTTRGVFDIAQWDLIGGIGNIDAIIDTVTAFGRILVNSTDPAVLNSANDVLLQAQNPNDIFRLIAGTGITLLHDTNTNSIQINAPGATGEANVGQNIGTGEDVYVNKIGVNLRFRGFSAANTGSSILSVSTVGDNIQYQVNEGAIDLQNLNSGSPTLNMLSDINAAAPNNGDLLQYNAGTSQWNSTSVASLGISSIYVTSSTISDANRIATLNAGSGSLRFKAGANNNGLGINNDGIRFNFGQNSNTFGSIFINMEANDTQAYQIDLQNNNAAGDSALRLNPTGGTSFILGSDESENSLGITVGAALAGPGTDDFSIDQNGVIYVPDLGSPSSGVTGLNHHIPFVSPSGGSFTQGEIQSDASLGYTYDGTSGSASAARQAYINYPILGTNPKAGLWVQNIPNNSATIVDHGIYTVGRQSSFGSWNRTSGLTATLLDSTGALVAETSVSHMQKDSSLFSAGVYTESKLNSLLTRPVYGFLSQHQATQDYQYGLGSIWVAVNNAQNRIGVYSNVIDSISQVSTISVDGVWAGYFKGCIKIEEGGLVLAESATIPDCNETTADQTSERTLWINSTNGNVYRGNVNLEEDTFKTLIASTSQYYTALPVRSTGFYVGGLKSGWDTPLASSPIIVDIEANDVIVFKDMGAGIPIPIELVEGDILKISGNVYRSGGAGANDLDVALAMFSCNDVNTSSTGFNITQIGTTQTLSLGETAKGSEFYDCFTFQLTVPPGGLTPGTDFLLLGFAATTSVTNNAISWSIVALPGN